MGLLDCVSDTSAKYPVTPPDGRPMERGMSQRRSMGSKNLFSSTTSLKGKGIDYWRHRLLGFLYKPESREDTTHLKMPLRQLGYNTIGDFIRDIPENIYMDFKNMDNLDTGLRKDYKVIWERDGIAEPGALKWEGYIDEQRCMGIQLDRKKAVPFGTNDGKGLFYCKPGHRALVPVSEVHPYKMFLRQFIGQPSRKDSMPLNLRAGRTSTRVAVTKKYTPGDRVHLPTEGKWATILWTGRIDGEWVVDLVFDPEKPATGRMASPDEPCMSRSLSMAEFIEQVGEETNSPTSPTPPSHVPPPPPKLLPPPKSPDLEDEVFIETLNHSPGSPVRKPDTNPTMKDNQNESEISSDSEEEVSEVESHVSSEADNTDHLSPVDPGVESSSDEDEPIKRTLSEPTPDLSKLGDSHHEQFEQKSNDIFRHEPLQQKPAHKPLFNLANFGKKNKARKADKSQNLQQGKRQQEVKPIKTSQDHPKKQSPFFSRAKFGMKSTANKRLEEPELTLTPIEMQSDAFKEEDRTPDKTRFSRLDRARSPVSPTGKTQGKSFDKDNYREVPIDVPQIVRVSKTSETVTLDRKSSTDSSDSTIPEPPKVGHASASKEQTSNNNEKTVQKTYKSSSSNDDNSDEDEGSEETLHAVEEKKYDDDNTIVTTKSMELDEPLNSFNDVEDDDENIIYDSSPPYSPAVKDVGLSSKNVGKSKNNPLKSFGAMFSTKKKILPPKDYEEKTPELPVRKESLEYKDKDEDKTSVCSMESVPKQPEPVQYKPTPKERSPAPTTPLGDQEGLILESLEVRDPEDRPTWDKTFPKPLEARRGSKGRTFSFGFSRKSKSTSVETTEMSRSQLPSEVSTENKKNNMKDSSGQNDVMSDTKPKKSSFRNSFTRTFSLTRDKNRHKNSMEKYDSVGDFRANKDKPSRPMSLYVDNNEAIGAKEISRKKSNSASVLVDIQPWNERRGQKTSILDEFQSSEEEHPSTPKYDAEKSPNPPPALIPKHVDSTIPKHRMFTTPKNFFNFGQKSTSDSGEQKPKKKSSFKGSKLPKFNQSSVVTEDLKKIDDEVSVPEMEPPPLPPTGPPKLAPRSPTKIPQLSSSELTERTLSGLSDVKQLKSALKQRKEIDSIPKGIKIGDRVIWYNGRIPIPGNVLKLYKDGTDKYTAVVKFARDLNTEPLSLLREGDGYAITVEELLTPELLGLPLTSVSSPPFHNSNFPTQTQVIQEAESFPTTMNNEADDLKSPSVRFSAPFSEPIVPEITVEPISPETEVPSDVEEDVDEAIPPPFQEEEVELACGLRRGIPSRDRTCCIESILFSLFYTTNSFDISLLHANGFEKDQLTRDIKALLRHEIVHPLRQNGFCEWSAIKKLKDLIKNASPDFNTMNTDAEIMTFIFFDRALKLGKFISYSTGVTDYIHQLVLDPKDHSKSNTLQRMFENSLELMDRSKLQSMPTPALIIEIPRANDHLVHYEAVIPNLSIGVSHLLENGPRLCVCAMAAKYECERCLIKFGEKALVYCENCKSMADQIHFQLGHESFLTEMVQTSVMMDLVAVVCVKAGHYTCFVKCGTQRTSPWLFYDGAEIDNPKVSLELNLGMWIDRLEKYPGKYTEAFVHPLLTHFLANSHICIYQPREKSSLV